MAKDRIEIEDMKHFVLKRESNVTCITFGGVQTWHAKEGEKFPFHFCKAINPDYVVVQSGANYYVLQTKDIDLGRTDMKWSDFDKEIENDKIRQSKLNDSLRS